MTFRLNLPSSVQLATGEKSSNKKPIHERTTPTIKGFGSPYVTAGSAKIFK